MKGQTDLINDLYKNTDTDPATLRDPNVAHLVIHKNKVLGMHALPGLEVAVTELEDGIDAVINLRRGTVIHKLVHLCFGMFPEIGIQRIKLDIGVEDYGKMSILAHCVFPLAIDVTHIMDAKISLGQGAEYSYFERHIHSASGGVKVYPRAKVEVGHKAFFKTEFELIKGRVGLIDIDYEATCGAESILDMTARISGKGDDIIKVRETGYLAGEYARGVLTSKIAVRDKARAEVYNKLIATGAYSRGHVDCKEIVQDNGMAMAVPIVEVKHPKAHVTHEAAIGSVDSKQLETLMSRGLSEDEGVEMIINGLLGK